MPKLQDMGVRLIMVSIGTPERSQDFVARTGFPASNLYLDPDNLTYTAIGLKKTFQDAFLNIATPLSLVKRVTEGKTEDLMDMLNGWEPWMTPRGPHQALQQGGLFVFEGQEVIYSHYDKATADHGDIAGVLKLIEMRPQQEDCGCDTPSSMPPPVAASVPPPLPEFTPSTPRRF